MKKIHTASAMLAAAFFGIVGIAAAQTSGLYRALDVGSSGSDVTSLQQFLATSPDIYPSGRVTGYFGALTSAAISQFQLNYGLPAVGRVGPLTLQRLHTVMASGVGIDISAPIISNVSVQPSRSSAVISWATNQSAQGRVVYDTRPLSVTETDQPFTAPAISGTAVSAAQAQSSQSITLSGLQPNTTYYYTIVATDASGNVQMTWPATFSTPQ